VELVETVKLVAMMIVKDEADRYLGACVRHLLEFCDEVRILDDGSQVPVSTISPNVFISYNPESSFFQDEGRARQQLLDWTMEAEPTHVLAIDADEFVADGQLLRRELEKGSATGVWKLTMTEVWGADERALRIRWDGKWSPRPIGIAFEVPSAHTMRHERQTRRHYRIAPGNATGRTPISITQAGNRTTTDPVCSILHLGWACEADREDRYARYANAGDFNHNSGHIKSIMFGDDLVEVRAEKWPPALDKETLLARINR
jgi:hypothetical protein